MDSGLIKYCECGCGAPVRKRFLPGHNNRGKNNISCNPEIATKIAKSNTGKVRSKDSREKQSESLRKVWKINKKMQNRRPPRKGTSTSNQARANMRAGALGKVLSDEHRDNIRQGLLEYLSVPENYANRVDQLLAISSGKKFETGYFEFQNQKPIFYRSSYERIALEILVSKSEVVSIKSESLRLPYQDKFGVNRVYIPDFLVSLVNGSQILIEVKPNRCIEEDRRIENSDVQSKLQAGIGWADENQAIFCVWTEDVLCNSSVTTTPLQEIVETTVATSYVRKEVEGIV